MLLRPRPIPSFPPLLASFHHRRCSVAAQLTTPTTPPPSQPQPLLKTALFIPPGVAVEDVSTEMVLPGSNIVLGPYAGEAKVKTVEFVKSSAKARDCPRDPLRRPEFAVLGRSNVGKSSLINSLVRKKDVALTSKKPGFASNSFQNYYLWSLDIVPRFCCLMLCIENKEHNTNHNFK
jgi:GTP-binding protein